MKYHINFLIRKDNEIDRMKHRLRENEELFKNDYGLGMRRVRLALLRVFCREWYSAFFWVGS